MRRTDLLGELQIPDFCALIPKNWAGQMPVGSASDEALQALP